MTMARAHPGGRDVRTAGVITLLAMSIAAVPAARADSIRSDETVVFLPTSAHRIDGGRAWQLDVHARIFEQEKRPLVTRALTPLRTLFELEGLSEEEERRFVERARLFLVDSEKRKHIPIRIGTRQLTMQRSDGNGFARLRHVLADADAQRIATGTPPRWLAIRAVLGQKDQRAIVGAVQLIEPTGVTIVSDVDDTIKDSNVLDRRELVRNTFARPYRAIAGMSAVYGAWSRADPGIAFHYVSASPWQLFEPLETFRKDEGFPPGSFHLREFALMTARAFVAPAASVLHKTTEIERLLRDFPDRRFVLIGDSGERDPEIYGDLARRFPRQITRIAIRDVTNELQSAPRYAKAFEGVQARWAVFREPTELGATPL